MSDDRGKHEVTLLDWPVFYKLWSVCQPTHQLSVCTKGAEGMEYEMVNKLNISELKCF